MAFGCCCCCCCCVDGCGDGALACIGVGDGELRRDRTEVDGDAGVELDESPSAPNGDAARTSDPRLWRPMPPIQYGLAGCGFAGAATVQRWVAVVQQNGFAAHHSMN